MIRLTLTAAALAGAVAFTGAAAHADTGPDRITRIAEGHRLAVDHDVACVLPVETR